MAASYPSSLKSFTNPVSTNFLSSPSHSTQHADENNEIVAIETYLGTNASQTTPVAAGRVLNSTSASVSSWTATPTLGVAGTTLGQIILAGNTSGSTTLQPNAAASGTLTFPAATDTLVGKSTTDTLANKTLDNSTVLNIKDANFTIQDDVDTTKRAQFQISSVTAGQTRTVTIPDSNTTLPIASQVITFSGPTVARTYTFPDASTTVVGLTDTQSPTNKTFDNTNSITVKDANFTLQDDGGTTRQAQFQLSGITAGNTRTITLPDSNTTLPIASQVVTISGPTAARTYTFPDAAATIARTDAGQTFTGVNTFTSPKIITAISDTNGNTFLSIVATASAVNYVEFTNAATGTAGPIIAAQGETNVDLKIAGKGTGGVHVTTGSYGDITADTDGPTITFNLATSNVHSVTLGGNRTLALSNAKVGQIFTIRLAQDATGSRTVTWFTTIKWAGGSAPTLTTTANKADTFVFLVTSSGNYDGYTVGTNV